MQSSTRNNLRFAALPLALMAALALAACDKPNDTTVGQKVDGAIAETRQATSEAASTVKTTAEDATITTKINAALAADDKLSAMKIDVDTTSGRVTLTGTAPDATSRDRATTLASAVSGVTSVDNRLAVKGS